MASTIVKNIPNIMLNDVAHRGVEKVRGVKSAIFNENEIEKKAKEATSNEKWNASSTMLRELASASFNYGALQLILKVIWKRIEEKGKYWRQVYKSLVLLNYLLVNGDGEVARMARSRDHMLQISTLTHFEYFNATGEDVGMNVRKRAKEIVELLKDNNRLAELRNESKGAAKKKYVGFSHDQYLRGSYDKMDVSSAKVSNSNPYSYDDPYAPSKATEEEATYAVEPERDSSPQQKQADEEDMFQSPDASPRFKPQSAPEENIPGPAQNANDEDDFFSDTFAPFVSAPQATKPTGQDNFFDEYGKGGSAGFDAFHSGGPPKPEPTRELSEDLFDTRAAQSTGDTLFDDDFNPRVGVESRGSSGSPGGALVNTDLLDIVSNIDIISPTKSKPPSKGKPAYVPMSSETRRSNQSGMVSSMTTDVRIERSPQPIQNMPPPRLNQVNYSYGANAAPNDGYNAMQMPSGNRPYITMMPIQQVKALNPNAPIPNGVDYFQKDWKSADL